MEGLLLLHYVFILCGLFKRGMKSADQRCPHIPSLKEVKLKGTSARDLTFTCACQTAISMGVTIHACPLSTDRIFQVRVCTFRSVRLWLTLLTQMQVSAINRRYSTVAVQITTTLNCLTSSVIQHKLLQGKMTCWYHTVTLAVDRLVYLHCLSGTIRCFFWHWLLNFLFHSGYQLRTAPELLSVPSLG